MDVIQKCTTVSSAYVLSMIFVDSRYIYIITYTITQQEEWHNERQSLKMQVTQLSHHRQSSMQEEVQWSQSMEAQYKEIDKLTALSQRSCSELLESQGTVAHLMEENGNLQAANDKLKEKVSADEIIIDGLNSQLVELKGKWSDSIRKCEEIEAAYAVEREKSQKVYDLFVNNQVRYGVALWV